MTSAPFIPHQSSHHEHTSRTFYTPRLPALRGSRRARPGAARAARRTRTTAIIDAHVHVWTPDTHRYPLAASFFSGRTWSPPSFTPEELFAHCRPQGVSRIVLIQMSFYEFDNRYMLDAIAQHPGVFRGVAIVDETKPDVRETMKTLAKPGRARLPALCGQGEGGGVAALRGDEGDVDLCARTPGFRCACWPIPRRCPPCSACARPIPRRRVVIDHFARIGMKGPVRPDDLDHLCRLADFEHTHVKTSAFYALGAKKAPYTDLAPHDPPLARCLWRLAAHVGQRLSVPGTEGHTYANSIALIRDRLDFLTAEDKHWMLRKTAEKVFFS